MGGERRETQNPKRDSFGINKSLFAGHNFSCHNFCPCFAQWHCLVLPGCCWAAREHLLPELPALLNLRGCGWRGGNREWWSSSSSSEQAPLAFAHLFDLTLSSNTRSFTACPGLPDEEVTLQRKEPAHAV